MTDDEEEEYYQQHQRFYESAYEAAMGKMLVRFNNLENAVGQMLEGLLKKLEVGHLYRPEDYFRQKVDRLELAMRAVPDWPVPDFNRLRKINSWRNDIAHSDFFQDPDTAAYLTRSLHKPGRRTTGLHPELIDTYTVEVSAAIDEVLYIMPLVWFQEPED